MKAKAKRKSGILKKIGLYFLWVISTMILGAFIFPADVNGYIELPSWYGLIVYFSPLLIPIVNIAMKVVDKFLGVADFVVTKTHDSSVTDYDNFRVPLSTKERNKLAQKLHFEIALYADKVNKTRSVSDFFLYYSMMMDSLEKAEKLDGKATCINGSFHMDRVKLESEYQKHIHDALERSCEEIVSEYKGIYKYDKNYMKNRIQAFKSECDANLVKMDDNNKGYANALFLYLCNECNAKELLGGPEEESESRHPVSTITDFADYELLKIDTMEGHDFEFWTADLLRNSGFSNVEVTKGSGDQGVDVLAQKDGIKYAIQCKCYSSNLGNTPIQEVNAGKVFYHCQVAAVITNQYFTQGAKELAEATGVLLWDRDWIRKMVEK